MQKSILLFGYSTFVGKVKKYKDSGMDRDTALTRALDECIAAGILAEFLNKNKEEIKTMFNTQWNMEDAMRVLGNECREEGWEEGREEGMAIGEARGRIEGALSTAVTSVRNLMDSFKLNAQAAMDALKISATDRPAILAAL